MSTLFDKQLQRLRRLEKRYSSLMKQSYQIAVRDRQKSKSIKHQALELKTEIDAIKEEIFAS